MESLGWWRDDGTVLTVTLTDPIMIQYDYKISRLGFSNRSRWKRRLSHRPKLGACQNPWLPQSRFREEQPRTKQQKSSMSIWRNLLICWIAHFLSKDPACSEAVYSQVAEPSESYLLLVQHLQPAHTRILKICDLCVTFCFILFYRICMYVCMYVCLFVCLFVCIYKYIHICR